MTSTEAIGIVLKCYLKNHYYSFTKWLQTQCSVSWEKIDSYISKAKIHACVG